jgi:hypothetical protein
MRLSPLVRQIAGQATQRKLPGPQIFEQPAVPRLTPPNNPFLPSLINAPTTLPPVLTSVDVNMKERFGVLKRIYYLGRSYFIFYKTGIKQSFKNISMRRYYKAQLQASLNRIMIPGSSNVDMTRSELQVCIRTRRDLRKLPRMDP